MSRIPPLEDCNFRAVPTPDGKFIGRVREFPDLRTKPQKLALNAIDEIVSLTREKLREIHSAAAGFGPARRDG